MPLSEFEREQVFKTAVIQLRREQESPPQDETEAVLEEIRQGAYALAAVPVEK